MSSYIFAHMNPPVYSTDQCYQEMRALWNEWDPIGVLPSESGILYEYDFYLESFLLLLKQAATTAEIENYLNLVIGEFMGFDNARINHCKPHEFAKKLQGDGFRILKRRSVNESLSYQSALESYR